MSRDYQICVRCIMDTSDPDITFDTQGYCNHCNTVESLIKPQWYPNDEGRQKLGTMIQEIKAAQGANPYDSIIGLSGGVDSSYLAYIAKKELGLNPLVVHVDAGWNSDEAVSNIENLTKRLGLDLHTIVINWEEMKDLQLAFLKAGVENQDIPQDHAFFAGLYSFSVKYKIKHVLNGSNFATESILPKSWGYNAMDSRYILDIHQKHGTGKLKTFPTVSFYRRYIHYPFIKRMKVIKPLNYMPYNKQEAMKILEKEVGWKYYGGKHHESRFTKFFQSYYLPTRFGYDKRRAHLASQVMAGEITRAQALEEIKLPSYNVGMIEDDMEFVAKKLGITLDQLKALVIQPRPVKGTYKSNEALIKCSLNLKRRLASLVR